MWKQACLAGKIRVTDSSDRSTRKGSVCRPETATDRPRSPHATLSAPQPVIPEASLWASVSVREHTAAVHLLAGGLGMPACACPSRGTDGAPCSASRQAASPSCPGPSWSQPLLYDATDEPLPCCPSSWWQALVPEKETCVVASNSQKGSSSGRRCRRPSVSSLFGASQ